jgi:hypothetical protein
MDTKENNVVSLGSEQEKVENSDSQTMNGSGANEPVEEQIDWAAVKADYLNGCGPKYLSEKYNIPLENVRARIKREGWCDEKREIQETAKLRVRERFSETLWAIQVETREEYRKMFADYRHRLNLLIGQTTDPKNLMTLGKALFECQNGEFKCLGISEAVDAKLNVAIDPKPVQEDEEQAKREQIQKEYLEQIVRNIRQKVPDLSREEIIGHLFPDQSSKKTN